MLSRNHEDPRYKHHGPMDAKLWRGRHQGDSESYAEEVARRLGGGAIVIKHGDFSFGVYQPKFKPLELEPEAESSVIVFEPMLVDNEWVIGLCLADGVDSIGLTRGDLATLMSVILPDAAALLDSLRGGRARHHKQRARPMESGHQESS